MTALLVEIRERPDLKLPPISTRSLRMPRNGKEDEQEEEEEEPSTAAVVGGGARKAATPLSWRPIVWPSTERSSLRPPAWDEDGGDSGGAEESDSRVLKGLGRGIESQDIFGVSQGENLYANLVFISLSLSLSLISELCVLVV